MSAKEYEGKRNKFLEGGAVTFNGPVKLSGDGRNIFWIIENYGEEIDAALKEKRAERIAGEGGYQTWKELKRLRKANKNHISCTKTGNVSFSGCKEEAIEKDKLNSKFIDDVHASIEPKQVFFGVEVARGVSKEVLLRYSLKKRAFTGPTSLDVELSFLLSNQALCRPGTYVIDPFCGSGGILIPCTVHGATCVGSDINFDILDGIVSTKQKKAKTVKNIRTNFSQYGLEKCYPDLMAMDFSPKGRNLRDLANGIYDAIICDPPYGARAGVRTSIANWDSDSPQGKTNVENVKTGYDAADSITDLVETSARLLKTGGRLVYFLPVDRTTYTPETVPKHPCLKVVSNSEQELRFPFSRRLITMLKTVEYTQEKIEQYKEKNSRGMSDVPSTSIAYSHLPPKKDYHHSRA